jgi:hypothetical protein
MRATTATARRTIVLRRRLNGAMGFVTKTRRAYRTFAEIGEATAVYEYSVLMTSKNDWFLRRGLDYVRAYPGEARPER